eukprot:COSAG04_NODE_966_length_9138_cov_6.958624_6_plen_384_part_00
MTPASTLLLAWALAAPPAAATLPPLLASIFTDHMVLQREVATLKVWGWLATPARSANATVAIISPGGEAAAYRHSSITPDSTKPPGSSLWVVPITAPLPAGVSFQVKVTTFSDGARRSRTLTDVVAGDVFLCGGQSNMAFTVRQSFGAEHAMATAASFGPLLRLFTVANTHNNSAQQTDVTALPAPTPGWHRSSNQSVVGLADFSYFSGACYFAGVSLRQRLPKVHGAASNGTVDVPIGLIASSWSGSAIEPWMPPAAFATCNRTVETDHLCMADTKPELGCSSMYNAMIAPLHRFPIKAIFWWQGEANGAEVNARVGDGHSYECEQKALISAWREGWRAAALPAKLAEPDIPFIFVLLEAFRKGYDKCESLTCHKYIRVGSC